MAKFIVDLNLPDSLSVTDAADYIDSALRRACDPYDDAFVFPYGAGDVDLLSVEAERPTVADMDFAEMELRVLSHIADRDDTGGLDVSGFRHGGVYSGPVYTGRLSSNLAQARTMHEIPVPRPTGNGNELTLTGCTSREKAAAVASDEVRKSRHEYNYRNVIHRKSGQPAIMRDQNSPWGGAEVQFTNCWRHPETGPEACDKACPTIGWTITAEEDYDLAPEPKESE